MTFRACTEMTQGHARAEHTSCAAVCRRYDAVQMGMPELVGLLGSHTSARWPRRQKAGARRRFWYMYSLIKGVKGAMICAAPILQFMCVLQEHLMMKWMM